MVAAAAAEGAPVTTTADSLVTEARCVLTTMLLLVAARSITTCCMQVMMRLPLLHEHRYRTVVASQHRVALVLQPGARTRTAVHRLLVQRRQ